MASLSRLIADLNAATLQMRDAALGDDWVMVKRIQKQRALMVQGIIDCGSLGETDRVLLDQLKSIREIEHCVSMKAIRRKGALGRSLEDLRVGSKKGGGKKRSVDSAYGVVAVKKLSG